jgi:hypothetical protein
MERVTEKCNYLKTDSRPITNNRHLILKVCVSCTRVPPGEVMGLGGRNVLIAGGEETDYYRP